MMCLWCDKEAVWMLKLNITGRTRNGRRVSSLMSCQDHLPNLNRQRDNRPLHKQMRVNEPIRIPGQAIHH